MGGPVYHYSQLEERIRWSAIILAVLVHLSLAALFFSFTVPLPENRHSQYIDVSFVDIPDVMLDEKTNVPKPATITIKPRQATTDKPEKLVDPEIRAEESNLLGTVPDELSSEAQPLIDVPNILQSSRPAEIGDSENAAPPKTSHIPSRWALKPPLATSRLVSLGFSAQDIECLTALKDDCKELRELVFAEYRLTNTQLAWTPNRADTGMPAEFRGMTHQQIMEKLGMNYAGGNAFQILPGIVIDGPLWDKLHGVNKTCRYVQYFSAMDSAQPGTLSSRRVCD